MPLQPGNYGFRSQEWGGDRFLEQPSGNNHPSNSMPQQNREFKERSEGMQRGGQQASGYYHKSIRNDDVRGSHFDMVTGGNFASSQNMTGPPMSNMPVGKFRTNVFGGQEMEDNQLPGQRSGVSRPSGDYTRSIPQLNREFKERSEGMQRGGQQASGYYHKSIRNDDVRRSDLDMVTEENFRSVQNIPNSHRYLQEQSIPEDAHSHPIQRGRTQASGSFKRTIPNHDPVTSSQLERPTLHSQAPDSSQMLHANKLMSQSEHEPQLDLGQTPNNYYWNFPRDTADVTVSQHDHQSHVTTAGIAPTRPSWTTLSDTDQVAHTKVLGRIFEWEDTTNTYTNVPNLSQTRQERESPQALYQNQNPEVLLQPNTLSPRPVESMGQNARATDQLYMNQARQNNAIQANQSHDYSNSQAIVNGGNFSSQTDVEVPEQTPTFVPPAPFLPDGAYQNTPVTFDHLEEEEKKRKLNNIVLAGVVVLCFLLAAVVVVILIRAV